MSDETITEDESNKLDAILEKLESETPDLTPEEIEFFEKAIDDGLIEVSGEDED